MTTGYWQERLQREMLVVRKTKGWVLDSVTKPIEPLDGMYRSRNGIPISSEKWRQLFADERYRTVWKSDHHDLRGRRHELSTVWMGLDHGGGTYYESMVFCKGHSCGWNGHQVRYHTDAEAMEGHQELLLRIAAFKWWHSFAMWPRWALALTGSILLVSASTLVSDGSTFGAVFGAVELVLSMVLLTACMTLFVLDKREKGR